VSFFDKSYFAFQIGYQSIFALLFGYLAWATRFESEFAGADKSTGIDRSHALVPVRSTDQASEDFDTAEQENPTVDPSA